MESLVSLHECGSSERILTDDDEGVAASFDLGSGRVLLTRNGRVTHELDTLAAYKADGWNLARTVSRIVGHLS